MKRFLSFCLLVLFSSLFSASFASSPIDDIVNSTEVVANDFDSSILLTADVISTDVRVAEDSGFGINEVTGSINFTEKNDEIASVTGVFNYYNSFNWWYESEDNYINSSNEPEYTEYFEGNRINGPPYGDGVLTRKRNTVRTE